MTVSWNTYEQLQEPEVRFGLTPHTLFLSNKAGSDASTTYPTSRTWNNHVTLNGLIPNTKYYYQVSNANASQIHSFKTPRLKGDRTVGKPSLLLIRWSLVIDSIALLCYHPDQPFTNVVVVDMGLFGNDGLSTTVGKGAANPLKPGETNTIQRLTSTKDDYEFVVHREWIGERSDRLSSVKERRDS